MDNNEKEHNQEAVTLISELIWTRIDLALGALQDTNEEYLKDTENRDNLLSKIQEYLIELKMDQREAKELMFAYEDARMSVQSAEIEAAYRKGFIDCLSSKGTLIGTLNTFTGGLPL